MLQRAQVRHRLPGRTRLALPGRRGDEAYLACLSDELARIPGVRGVNANPATGSLLLTHEGDLEDIARMAEERGLLSLVYEVTGSVRVVMRRRLDRLSDDIRQMSGGTIDLGDLVLLLLLGISVRELLKGHLAMPSVATLAWYALNALSYPPVPEPPAEGE